MVNCSWINDCKKKGKECHHCSWNADNRLDDFLLIEKADGRTLKFLKS